MGFSQEILAERAGLHRTYVADVERGARNLSLSSIEKLANALEVTTAALLSHTTDPNTASRDPRRQLVAGAPVDILLVEDNNVDADFTLRAFQKGNIANPVYRVRDGVEALDFLFGRGEYTHRIVEARPQVVLLDLNLPKLSGLEVLRRLKADPSTAAIPVIVLTVSQSDRDIAECRRLGAESYIVKPVDFLSFTKTTPTLDLHWNLLRPRPAAP